MSLEEEGWEIVSARARAAQNDTLRPPLGPRWFRSRSQVSEELGEQLTSSMFFNYCEFYQVDRRPISDILYQGRSTREWNQIRANAIQKYPRLLVRYERSSASGGPMSSFEDDEMFGEGLHENEVNGEGEDSVRFGAQSLGARFRRDAVMSSHEDQDQHEAKGFAKLDFHDGDYIITTLQLVIGRNMDLADTYRRQRKDERRQQRAQDALEQYELEPSQPSQSNNPPGNGNPSSRSGSLEGRPAPGLPSNFSQQGGAIHYQDVSDDERMPRSRKRRRVMRSNSSNTSVTPNSVHPSQIDLSGNSLPLDGEQDLEGLARLPVHPANPNLIMQISQDHLLIYYNANLEKPRWELQVLGNFCYVNSEKVERDGITDLDHDDEIMIPGVRMYFKLPDNHQPNDPVTPGTFSERQNSEVVSLDDSDDDASPSQQRSRANGAVDSGGEDSEAEDGPNGQGLSRKRGGVKLKLKKPASGGKQRPQEGIQSPEDERKASKSVKTKPAEGTPGENDARGPVESPSAPAPTFEPDSSLADVPQEELPQKRKGPGRPPKNGYVSKKDDKQVKKKQREFESRGEPVPAYSVLVEEVRREAKLKEQQNRSGGAASGEMDSVVPSIENPVKTEALAGATTARAGSPRRTSMPSAAGNDQARGRSPKPRKSSRDRSLSPVKPEAECTEEELKKPTVTYVPLIDEAIRCYPLGYADLQQIYKAMQKLHPYFAYRVDSSGWQSSVRHNLKSERFYQVGRSGKGGFHAINESFPLPNSEQKKGRKATPPQRQPMPMQNGQYVGGQMAQPQHGFPQSQHPMGHANTYQNPNASQMQGNPPYQPQYQQGRPPGQMQQQQGAPGYPPPSNQPRPNGTPGHTPGPPQPRQQPEQQPVSGFGGLVGEIMAWRMTYLRQFVQTNEFETRELAFKAVLDQLSQIHSAKPQEYFALRTKIPDQLRTDEERVIFHELARLFDKYKNIEAKENENRPQSRTSPQQNTAAPPTNGSGQVHNAVGAAVAQADASANANAPPVSQSAAAPAVQSTTAQTPQMPSPLAAPPAPTGQAAPVITSPGSNMPALPNHTNNITPTNSAGPPYSNHPDHFAPPNQFPASTSQSPAPVPAPAAPMNQVPAPRSSPTTQLPTPQQTFNNPLSPPPAGNRAGSSPSAAPPAASATSASLAPPTATAGSKRAASDELSPEGADQHNKRFKAEEQ